MSEYLFPKAGLAETGTVSRSSEIQRSGTQLQLEATGLHIKPLHFGSPRADQHCAMCLCYRPVNLYLPIFEASQSVRRSRDAPPFRLHHNKFWQPQTRSPVVSLLSRIYQNGRSFRIWNYHDLPCFMVRFSPEPAEDGLAAPVLWLRARGGALRSPGAAPSAPHPALQRFLIKAS